MSLLLALEPRLFFDAAGLSTVFDTPDVSAPLGTEPREMVFVASDLPDLPGLVQEWSGANRVVVVVDAARDGVAQVTEALAREGVVSALHVVGHGRPGGFQLGESLITPETLDAYAEGFSAWRGYLAPGADLLLYGCSVAGDDGQLLHGLADLTGADVAASDDPTGATALGGDWQLEAVTGSVSTAALQADWDHLLIVYPSTGEINTLVESFEDYLATWPLSTNDAGFTNFFHTNFKDGGHTAAQWIADLDDDGPSAEFWTGLDIQVVSVVNDQVTFNIIYPGASDPAFQEIWYVGTEGGSWKLLGNQSDYYIEVMASSVYLPSRDVDNIFSRLEFHLDNPLLRAVDYVELTGPGITGTYTWNIESGQWSSYDNASFTAVPYLPGWDFSAIFGQSQLQYTFTLFDSSDNQLDSQTDLLFTPPLAPGALTPADFANVTITLETTPDLFAGGPARVSWSRPTAWSAPDFDTEVKIFWQEGQGTREEKADVWGVNSHLFETGSFPGGYFGAAVEVEDRLGRDYLTWVEYSPAGLGHRYYVFGSNTQPAGGFSADWPEEGGFTLIGSGNGSSPLTINNSYAYYAVVVPPGNHLPIDQIVFGGSAPSPYYDWWQDATTRNTTFFPSWNVQGDPSVDWATYWSDFGGMLADAGNPVYFGYGGNYAPPGGYGSAFAIGWSGSPYPTSITITPAAGFAAGGWNRNAFVVGDPRAVPAGASTPLPVRPPEGPLGGRLLPFLPEGPRLLSPLLPGLREAVEILVQEGLGTMNRFPGDPLGMRSVGMEMAAASLGRMGMEEVLWVASFFNQGAEGPAVPPTGREPGEAPRGEPGEEGDAPQARVDGEEAHDGGGEERPGGEGGRQRPEGPPLEQGLMQSLRGLTQLQQGQVETILNQVTGLMGCTR